MNFLLVFFGGGIGSMARYSITVLLKKYNYNFPFATLISNILACLVLGYLIGLVAKGGLAENHKFLFITGFCGGFSTFSTFSAETLQLFQNGMITQAVLNIVVSLVICIACVMLGNMLAGS